MDHLQIAVFLSMAGAFILGLMLGLAWRAMEVYGRGVHHGRMEATEELALEVATARLETLQMCRTELEKCL